MRGGWVPGLLVVIGLTCASRVAAQETEDDSKSHPLAEAVRAPGEGCLAQQTLAPAIELWLGRARIDRRIRIQVEETEAGARFTLFRDDEAAAERRFEKDELPCADVRAAVALAIALAIDATILNAIMVPTAPPSEPVELEETPLAPEQPTPRPPRTAPPSPPRTKPPERRRAFAMDARLFGSVGVLPEPAVGGGLGVRWPIAQHLRMDVEGWGTAGRRVEVGPGEATVAMVAGQVEGCFQRREERSSVAACAGAALGRWDATGRGFPRDRSTQLPWAAIVAGLDGSYDLSETWFLAADLTAIVPFVQPVLSVYAEDGSRAATSRAPPAGAFVGVGLGAHFR